MNSGRSAHSLAGLAAALKKSLNILLEIFFLILKILVPPLPPTELWTLAAALGSIAYNLT